MFNISSKADYGLVIMLSLARFAESEKDNFDSNKARRAKNYQKSLLSINEITESRQLSAAYLTQITKPLKKAGLLLSKEGKNGGYSLAKSPAEISVLEILEALEGKIKENRHNCSAFCAAFHHCEAKSIWPNIMSEISGLLAKKTLADLLNQVK